MLYRPTFYSELLLPSGRSRVTVKYNAVEYMIGFNYHPPPPPPNTTTKPKAKGVVDVASPSAVGGDVVVGTKKPKADE